MGELAAPILVHAADSLTFDDDAGTLSASLLAVASHETPSLSLTLDQVIAVLRPSSSRAQPVNVVVGLVEDGGAEQQPFRLVAIQTSADVPPQLASVPRIAQLPAHLARGAGSSGLVVDYVLSTKAGAGRAVLFWETALRPLLHVAAQALAQDTEPDRVVVTDSDDSVREYAREKRPAGMPRTIVLLSGDGGVVDLLNSSSSSSSSSSSFLPPPLPLPTIVLVPLGTGNALFNSLHKPLFTGPSELVLALRTLLNGVAAPLPTFRASFPPGSRIVKYANKDAAAAAAVAVAETTTTTTTTPPDVAASAEAQLFRQETDVDTLHGSIVASYGFHASIVYESDTPAYRAHGAARFGMVGQQLLKTSHAYAAQVAVRPCHHHGPGNDDSGHGGGGGGRRRRLDRIPRDTHAYVLGALVSNLERTFTISPASRPLDGQLRLVHFAPLGPARTMEAMMKAYDGGKHVEAAWDEDGERVYYEDVEEFAVTVEDEEERWRKVCIDGTIVDIPRGGTVHVQREEEGRFHIVVDSSVL
ncbi:Diacylglycerol kinase, catalytic region [Beauveria brongniartii RCEF 3172]|uniref:Diacylglycerol kinase, catalytic region n=1 Tax=Beauveria brongniartii RCEF 3172 TaxID=1081107 RepID=A0A167C4Y5_9HYPO|nr:Diacylglycerol kinase, catalytic region [Beauveria brongniartii RCEF 3172]